MQNGSDGMVNMYEERYRKDSPKRSNRHFELHDQCFLFPPARNSNVLTPVLSFLTGTAWDGRGPGDARAAAAVSETLYLQFPCVLPAASPPRRSRIQRKSWSRHRW